MDLNQLQAFDQIIQQGSFSKAARRLNISQPSISLRLQALEQEVGGALFIRGGSRLHMTDLGKSFAPYARQALNAMNGGIEMAQRTIQGKHGQVMIGTHPSLTAGFFATTLARLHQTQPQLDIAVHTGHNQQVLEMLHDGFIHIGLITGPYFSPSLTNLLQIQEPLIIVAHIKHPLAQQAHPLTLADLEATDTDFLQIDWSLEVRYWQTHTLQKKGPLIEVPPHTALDLMLQNRGVALMTRSLALSGLQSQQLVELEVQDMPALHRESILLCLNRSEELPLGANAWIRLFREETWDYRQP
jgi:DNA-binding transcriptional LysR family regulator